MVHAILFPQFDTAAFGWDRVVSVPVYAELQIGPTRGLGLYQRAGFGHNTGVPAAGPVAGHTTSTELYLRYPEVETVIVALESAGARALSPLSPRPWGDRAAYFCDLDSNVIAVACPAEPVSG